ncbi:MAG TPA: molybdenum cofactor biosynthesis protein MoaE [Candidatus Acidoferrales bacterium]|nr:molybdenum cofactor biosynthesis protein MoaE [Candidatus Acidoferrales bacterium]
MHVRVLFFGRLKEISGVAEEETDVAEGARIADLFETYSRRFPELARLQPSIAAAINQNYSQWHARLAAGDEVAFLPPVSGGAAPEFEVEAGGDICEIVEAAIAVDEHVQRVKAAADGAVVVFEGIVRNHSRGRETLFLVYEAYQPMALAEMREICAEMRRRFTIDRITMIHRLGRLEIGETSILIAVSSAHRAAAFDACRFAIDTFKRTVPIWKREHFRDGGVWADGETPPLQPFPPSGESIA